MLVSRLPLHLQDIAEFKQINRSLDEEVNHLNEMASSLLSDSVIMTASESRVQEWEKWLGINPEGNLYQRKLFLIATLSGSGKLNEEKIKSLVKIYTGGSATVTFANSTINVKVLPPKGQGELFRFDDIQRTLQKLIPAHLGLNIERDYATWSDIKQNFASWNAVKSGNTDWNAVKNYVKDGE